MTQKASRVPSPGNATFIPKTPVIIVSGRTVTAEHGQQPQHVVLAVRDHRLVRRLEPLDDLLVVVEEVPDPLGRVDDVVEVELELLGQERLDAPLEHRSVERSGLMILR